MSDDSDQQDLTVGFWKELNYDHLGLTESEYDDDDSDQQADLGLTESEYDDDDSDQQEDLDLTVGILKELAYGHLGLTDSKYDELAKRSSQLVEQHFLIQKVKSEMLEEMKSVDDSQTYSQLDEKKVEQSGVEEGSLLGLLLQSEILAKEITMGDREVLAFLDGISKTDAHTTKFIFKSNPFFTNEVLTVKVEMDGSKVKRIKGDDIHWKDEQNDVEESDEDGEFDRENDLLVVDLPSMKLKKFPKSRKFKMAEKSFFDIFATKWLYQWDRIVDGEIFRSNTRGKGQKRDPEYLEILALHSSRVARIIFTLDESILSKAKLKPICPGAEDLTVLSKLTLEERTDSKENKRQIQLMENTLEFRTQIIKIVNENPKFDDFWLCALMAEKVLEDEILKGDLKILRHLEGISCHPTEKNDIFSVRFEFSFQSNDFFTNQSLSKVYFLKNNSVTRSTGTRIDWIHGNENSRGFFGMFKTKVEAVEDEDDFLNYQDEEYELMLALMNVVLDAVRLYHKRLEMNRMELEEARDTLDLLLRDLQKLLQENEEKFQPELYKKFSSGLMYWAAWRSENENASIDDYNYLIDCVFRNLDTAQKVLKGEITVRYYQNKI